MRINNHPRPRSFRLMLVAGLAAAAATAATASPGMSASNSGRTVTYIVANPRISLSGPLMPATVEGSTFDNYQGGRKVGLDYVTCTFVDTRADNECAVTVVLPGGTMQLAYRGNVDDSHLTAPIVGGTGRYLGARGYTVLVPFRGRQRAVAHLL